MSEDERREQIVAAVRVAMNQFGVRRLTVSDVAIEAGVSRQTIYEYFPNREALVAAALNAGGLDLIATSEATSPGPGRPADRLSRLIEVVLGYFATSPLWATDAKRAELVPYVTPRDGAFTAAAVEALQGRMAGWWPRADPARLARAADTVVRTLISHGLGPEARPGQEVARELADLVATALEA